MRDIIHVKRLAGFGLVFLLISGCSAFVTVTDRTMQVEDIINMTKADVDSTIIERQIEVTHSKFELDIDQIIQLKKEGVADRIIEAMIKTSSVPDSFSWEYWYLPYDFWFDYFDYNYIHYPVYIPYPYFALPYYVNPYTGVPKSKSVFMGLGWSYPYTYGYPPYRDFSMPNERVYPCESDK